MDRGELELAWEQHRGYLRRLLAHRTQNPDVTDDLLQETYLLACHGLAAHRGGDVRAWLAAIARNAFLQQVRRAGRRAEESLQQWDSDDLGLPAAGEDPVTLLALREAIAALSPVLRDALVLRYYGALSYRDLGRTLDCPEGTARRRVWSAVRKLRQLLTRARTEREPEVPVMSHPQDGELLDYAWGIGDGSIRAKIREHLQRCGQCTAAAGHLRELAAGLEAAQGDHVLLHLQDLAADGAVIAYACGRVTNDGAEPLLQFGMANPAGVVTERFSVEGVSVPLTVGAADEGTGMTLYTARLPRPVPPGESFRALAVTRSDRPADRAAPIGGGRWSYCTQKGLGDQRRQALLVHAVLLPEGATLLKATPEPTAVRRAGPRTTVVWRLLPPPQEATEYCVEYQAGDSAG